MFFENVYEPLKVRPWPADLTAAELHAMVDAAGIVKLSRFAADERIEPAMTSAESLGPQDSGTRVQRASRWSESNVGPGAKEESRTATEAVPVDSDPGR